MDLYADSSKRSVLVSTVPGPISGLRVVEISKGSWAVAFSGTAAPNGTLYNPELASKPVSTGKAYTALFVRHWDTCKSAKILAKG